MRAVFLGLASIAVAVLSGCGDSGALEFDARVPPQWLPWPDEPPKVPGTLLATYKIPTGQRPGSLAIFRSAYRPNTTAEQLLVERRNLVRGLPTMEVLGGSVIEVGQRKATLLELRAAGTGSALAPSALGEPIAPNNGTLIPTRRLWVAIPRERDTIELFFHCPEAEWERLRGEWERVLESLRV